MSDAATRLQAAKDAYEALLMGQQIREIRDQSGETIVYTRGDIPMLLAYIRQLELQVNGTRHLGPLRAVF